MDIEELIQNDIQRIQNNGAKKQREIALRKYFDNPNFCTYCSKMIVPNVGQSTIEVRKKKFCDRSCSASYNNAKRDEGICGPSTFVELCDDEEFVHAYISSKSYNELAKAIGYKNSVGSNVKQKLIEKMNSLGLAEYEQKNLFNSMTKEELMSKRSNWQSWRSSIQKDARKVYINSDKPKCCVVCGYSNTYEVAHVVPVSEFDNDTLISEINDIENLMALCPNHHWEYDHNMLDVSERIKQKMVV